jgi:hypothetical protein
MMIKDIPSFITPTPLQLSIPRSWFLDWVAVEPLRNQLIAHHHKNSAADQIWLDLMFAFVIQLDDMSLLLLFTTTTS